MRMRATPATAEAMPEPEAADIRIQVDEETCIVPLSASSRQRDPLGST